MSEENKGQPVYARLPEDARRETIAKLALINYQSFPFHASYGHWQFSCECAIGMVLKLERAIATSDCELYSENPINHRMMMGTQ